MRFPQLRSRTYFHISSVKRCNLVTSLVVSLNTGGQCIEEKLLEQLLWKYLWKSQ